MSPKVKRIVSISIEVIIVLGLLYRWSNLPVTVLTKEGAPYPGNIDVTMTRSGGSDTVQFQVVDGSAYLVRPWGTYDVTAKDPKGMAMTMRGVPVYPFSLWGITVYFDVQEVIVPPVVPVKKRR